MIKSCTPNWLKRATVLLLASLTSPNLVFAAPGQRIGDAVVVVNDVKADERKLTVGDDVRQDETIAVSADAQSELKLDDDTKLALGPGSRLLLDKFVYDSDKKAGSIVINLAKGAFRFITGSAAKKSYVVKTPNASITVRGTVFDVFTLQDGNVWVLLHEGAVEVTGSKGGVCRVLDQPGRVMRISRSGRVSRSVNWSKLPGNSDVPFETAFPFVIKAPQVDPTARVSQAEIIQAAFEDGPDKACINPAFTPPPIKIRKADDDNDAPKPPKKLKRQAVAPEPVEEVQPVKPKKRKVVKQDDDDGDKPLPPKRKRKVVKQDDEPKSRPVRTAKRPRGGDGGYGDDCPGCVTGMDIVIGGGGGFGGGHRMPNRGDGGNRGR